MKILVSVKRVVDYNVKVRVKADWLRRRDHWRKNVDEPVQTKSPSRKRCASRKKGIAATEIVIVSIGPDSAQETIPRGIGARRRSRHPRSNRQGQ